MRIFAVRHPIGPVAGVHAEETGDLVDSIGQCGEAGEGKGVLQFGARTQLLPRSSEIAPLRLAHVVTNAYFEILKL